jgi:hypothetical protein
MITEKKELALFIKQNQLFVVIFELALDYLDRIGSKFLVNFL